MNPKNRMHCLDGGHCLDGIADMHVRSRNDSSTAPSSSQEDPRSIPEYPRSIPRVPPVCMRYCMLSNNMARAPSVCLHLIPAAKPACMRIAFLRLTSLCLCMCSQHACHAQASTSFQCASKVGSVCEHCRQPMTFNTATLCVQSWANVQSHGGCAPKDAHVCQNEHV